MMIGVLWQFHGSFLEVSWNCPYLACMRFCFGAGVAGKVVSSTCTFGRQAFEPIAPEFLTCTTSALLGERIGWRGHVAAASQTRLLISGSVLTSRVSKAGGAEMAPEGIWHSGWPRARAWQNAIGRRSIRENWQIDMSESRLIPVNHSLTLV